MVADLIKRMESFARPSPRNLPCSPALADGREISKFATAGRVIRYGPTNPETRKSESRSANRCRPGRRAFRRLFVLERVEHVEPADASCWEDGGGDPGEGPLPGLFIGIIVSLLLCRSPAKSARSATSYATSWTTACSPTSTRRSKQRSTPPTQHAERETNPIDAGALGPVHLHCSRPNLNLQAISHDRLNL